MKNQNKQKGITLVALVITIIILLILAGISISSLTNQGLFTKAQQAKQESENAQREENEILTDYLEQMEAITGGVIKFQNVDKTKTNPEAAMPNGATLIEGDANKGIVIKDSKNNEWVWVEVPMSVTAGKTTDSDIETALKAYAKDYRGSWTDTYYSGCGMTETEYNTAKSKMLQSIKTNGGFWISRYEAGIKGSDTDTTKARTESSSRITDETISTLPEAVSQVNMIPYNYVYCSEAQALAKKMSTDTSKTSSLLFGIQWDLVCKFLQEKGGLSVVEIKGGDDTAGSTNWGNYANSQITNAKGKYAILDQDTWKLGNWTPIPSGYIKPNTNTNKDNWVLLSTGASDTLKKMNIYDFAGNEWEWTLEHASSNSELPCASRGGNYINNGSTDPASVRYHYRISNSAYDISFRSTLY